MMMFSLLSSTWLLRRDMHSGRRTLTSRRHSCKPWLELLEDRNLLALWTTVAPMPTALAFLAGATGSDSRIYAFDGSDDLGNVLRTVQAYSTNTNAWSVVAMMNTARDGVAAAAGLDGRIYVFGGSIFGFTPFDTVEAFSPPTRTASTVAHMTTPRDAPAGTSGPDGRIYAFGGSPDGTVAAILNSAEAYNTRTNIWTPVASMSTPRHGAAAALGFDGRLYVFGGMDNSGNILKTVECYSPTANRWTTVASMTTARWFPAAARGPNGRLYVFGGTPDGATILNTVESYNPNRNAWSPEPPMPTGRAGLAAATGFDGRIYAFGGLNPAGFVVNTVQVLAGFGGFGGAATGAKSPSDASADPISSTALATTPTAPLLLETSNPWGGPGNAASDSTLRKRADVVFASGADALSDDLADLRLSNRESLAFS
jgi:N-acetylneuraminic acid mutarotase